VLNLIRVMTNGPEQKPLSDINSQMGALGFDGDIRKLLSEFNKFMASAGLELNILWDQNTNLYTMKGDANQLLGSLRRRANDSRARLFNGLAACADVSRNWQSITAGATRETKSRLREAVDYVQDAETAITRLMRRFPHFGALTSF
jgi:hypothetical protein